ncbi:MAG: cell division protein SepF [Demequinaceae bacterium]|nr:cell division protein SepF [Demequinaceae bacterium]
MGALHKAMVYLGFSADEYEPYPDPDGPMAPVTPLHDVNHPRPSRGSPSTPYGATPAMDLRKIQTVKPRSYNDARVIGEAYREGIPVIMNLTEMTDADAKRLVDFSAGLSFGLQGSIERVTTSVFLLSPAHVEIGVESEPATSERSFFNQS